MKEIVLAFAGNPNCGKTTLFNEITGSKQHVGNWPGVTVEYKEGSVTRDNVTYKIVDLPGLYSMSANSYEEIVSRDFLIREKVDIIVNICDSSILERSLYLTTQLMEIGLPMLMVFNMEDVVKNHKIEVDFSEISKSVNVPYITTQGSKTKSFDSFFEKVNEIYDHKEKYIPRYISYSAELETEIRKQTENTDVRSPFRFEGCDDIFIVNENHNPIRLRWYVIRGFEGDAEAVKTLQKNINSPANVGLKIDITRGHMSEVYGETLEEIFTDDRYGYVGGITSRYINYSHVSEKPSHTDKIDNVLLNRWLGIPLFALIMFLIFTVAFTVGDWFANLFSGWIGRGAELLRPCIGNEFMKGLVCDGIIGGVGSVIVFVPTIALMFVMISLLEDSGYMSRAAFLSDRAMHAMGLHGKSFISMLLGFGCNVPAIMGARILESRADRIVTVMLNPLMSCSARLPIYVFFTSIFFEAKWRPVVIMSVYAIGIVLAIIMGKFFRSRLFDTKESPFVMEMPSYRVPTFRGTFIHSWERTKEFLLRAGTVITLVCIIIWALSVFPSEDNSFVYIIGHFLEPVMKPIGLDWMAAVACIFGIGAKEVIVATLNIIGGTAGDTASLMREAYTPLQSYIFMMFALIYCPCAATIVAMKKEIGNVKYFLISVLYPICLAWIICFAVYQISRLFS